MAPLPSKLATGLHYENYHHFKPVVVKAGSETLRPKKLRTLYREGKLYDWQQPTEYAFPPLDLSCSRCNRTNHDISSCFAKTKSDGTQLPALVYKWSNALQRHIAYRPWLKKK